MINETLSVCVYCGARSGSESAYIEAARSMGTAIARRRWQLVYGGGKVGLMGELANAALANGTRVIGVIPETLMQREVGHHDLHELHVVQTMHQRKQMMAERADMFIAMPGGIGTLEELFEVWTWRQLGYHSKPIGLLNVAGYFDQLLAFMARSTDEGFLSPAQHGVLVVDQEPDRLLSRLADQHASTGPSPDLARI